MLEGDFKVNILSYEYHQIKDIVNKTIIYLASIKCLVNLILKWNKKSGKML